MQSLAVFAACLLVGCATAREPMILPPEPKAETRDVETIAAEHFKNGLEADTLCSKATNFEMAVFVSPDTKSGKLAASHLKRIDAKFNKNVKDTVAFYARMVKAGASASELSNFSATAREAVSGCSYRPAVERMENALADMAEKYRGQNVAY